MHRPTVWTRLRASAHGQVSASALEAYRGASLVVLDLVETVDAVRRTGERAGQTPWTRGLAEQHLMVCAWNAMALQSLGVAFVDAAYVDDPKTVGYVSPVTAEQALAFFTLVEEWLARAGQISEDPTCRIDATLPASLPAWCHRAPIPRSHLFGLLEAMIEMREHAGSAVADLGRAEPADPEAARQYHAIRGLFASAETKARYCEDLYRARTESGSNPAMDGRIADSLSEAIGTFHRVGQLAAMPALVDVPLARAPLAESDRRPGFGRPLPHEKGFDVWCLSDMRARAVLEKEYEARKAIERLWACDPDPRSTLHILGEIEAAIARGDVVRAVREGGGPIGYYYRCPWGTVWETTRPITIDKQRLATNQRFVFETSADGVESGRPFRRGLRFGSFDPTSEIDYGRNAISRR